MQEILIVGGRFGGVYAALKLLQDRITDIDLRTEILRGTSGSTYRYDSLIFLPDT